MNSGETEANQAIHMTDKDDFGRMAEKIHEQNFQRINAGSVNTASMYIKEDEIDWLVDQLRGDTELHVDVLELETAEGMLLFDVEDGQLRVAHEMEAVDDD